MNYKGNYTLGFYEKRENCGLKLLQISTISLLLTFTLLNITLRSLGSAGLTEYCKNNDK